MCDRPIKIVLDHQHHGSASFGFRRVVFDWVCLHFILGGSKAAHVDVAFFPQLLGELLSELFVQRRWDVAERIAQRKAELFVREIGRANGSMGHAGALGAHRSRLICEIYGLRCGLRIGKERVSSPAEGLKEGRESSIS